ncbi:MAG: hypothetical protein EOO75_14925, partial [Myxococcales bacterium]
IGSIKNGYFADLTIWDSKGKGAVDAVIRGKEADLSLVMRAGLVLTGEGDLVDALDPTGGAKCEVLDVCGSSKKVCAERETGLTIAAMRTAIESKPNLLNTPDKKVYDLFFCGAPANEPSCVPSRPNEFTGVPSATDKDGDGIADDQDICPTVFSAVRPMDSGKQTDADGDGVGDGCDVCPLKASSEDCPLVQGDIDADGKPDATDNCPSVPNVDQKDTDADGKGDLCDACPNDANPGATSCPAQVTTVDAINKGTVADGADVSLKGLCVTHTAKIGNNFAYWVQDPALTEYAGLYVFNGTKALTVATGDKVDLSGKVDIYFSLPELTNAAATKTGTCPAIAPVVVNAADIAINQVDETKIAPAKYISMLVQVNSVAVTASSAPPENKLNEFVVTGGLRVGNLLYAYTSPAVGTTYSSITGLLYFNFQNSKLVPRSAADLVSP